MADRKADLLQRLRAALGRREDAPAVPEPPEIDEPVVRLVHTPFGLPKLFARMARANGTDAEMVYPEELLPRLAEYLRGSGVRRVAMPSSSFLERLSLTSGLREAGVEVALWSELTPDERRAAECVVTDVDAAVAETGSLVIRSGESRWRSLVLMPRVVVAVLEPRCFLPDWLDLMEMLKNDAAGGDTVVLTGPAQGDRAGGPSRMKAYVLE